MLWNDGKGSRKRRVNMEVVKKMMLNVISHALLSFGLGLFLVINPVGTSKTLVFILGGVIVAYGVLQCIRYLRNADSGSGRLLYAVFLCFIGLGICLNTQGLVSLLSKMISVIVILCGFSSMEHASRLRKAKVSGSLLNMIFAVSILGIGIVTLLIPFGAVSPVVCVLGVVLMVSAVVEIYHLIKLRRISGQMEGYDQSSTAFQRERRRRRTSEIIDVDSKEIEK